MPRERVTQEVRAPRGGPRPPWWEQYWWVGLLLILVFVGLLVAFFALRESDDDEAAGDRPTTVMTDTVAETGTTTQTETQTETETETATQTVTTEPEPAEVPDVVGQGHIDAGQAIEERGLIADSYPVGADDERGTVVAQNPDGGTELDTGDRVRINISLGPGDRRDEPVPDVTGLEEGDARATLRRSGFTVLTRDRDAPEPDNVGEVILQRPSPGNAPVLTQVTIFVGR